MPIDNIRIHSREPIQNIPNNNPEIKNSTTYSMLIFIAKKQQEGKKTTIAYKVFGKKADEINALPLNTKIHVKYVQVSKKVGKYWNTDLIVKSYELYDEYIRKRDEYMEGINSEENGTNEPPKDEGMTPYESFSKPTAQQQTLTFC